MVIDTVTARKALADLPESTSYGEIPDLQQVYLPRSHLNAMKLDVSLVTGMRGAGKTFWWSALRQSGVRRLISAADPRSAPSEDTKVHIGFGVAPAPDDYPSIDVFPRLLQNAEPKAIWRAVLARHMAPENHPLRQNAEWRDRVAWVESKPEAVDRLLHERDVALEQENGHFLVLFDALDRCAGSWKEMHRAIRGLLQMALDIRPYRRLWVKIFLRSDQMDGARIADFPDASKILSSGIDLDWPRRELYGLLWHAQAPERFKGPIHPRIVFPDLVDPYVRRLLNAPLDAIIMQGAIMVRIPFAGVASGFPQRRKKGSGAGASFGISQMGGDPRVGGPPPVIRSHPRAGDFGKHLPLLVLARKRARHLECVRAA